MIMNTGAGGGAGGGALKIVASSPPEGVNFINTTTFQTPVKILLIAEIIQSTERLSALHMLIPGMEDGTYRLNEDGNMVTEYVGVMNTTKVYVGLG